MAKNDRLTEPIESELADHDASLRSYEVLTYPADFTLEILVDKWNKGDINIAPGQRQFVWNQTKASKLIESFLIGLPVPPVYFYQEKDDNNFLVVDGQQRLKSIVYFFSGLFGNLKDDAPTKKKGLPTFNLIGLDEKSQYFEKTYQYLKEKDSSAYNKLNNSVLRSFVMKQIFPKDDTSIFQVFERLNTGGMILQPQEIRNCVLYGRFNDLLKRLNQHESWRQIVGRKLPDKRMRDVELILRFFALFYNLDKYEKPMKGFLNKYMKSNRNPSDEEQATFTRLFTRTADTVVKYLGDRPFSIHRGLNIAVYDALFTGFAKHINKLDHPNVSKERIREMKTKYTRLLRDKNFIKWTGRATTDIDVVKKRVNKAIRVFG